MDLLCKQTEKPPRLLEFQVVALPDGGIAGDEVRATAARELIVPIGDVFRELLSRTLGLEFLQQFQVWRAVATTL